MKNLVATILMSVAFLTAHAQTTASPTIDVYGVASFEREIDRYQAEILITPLNHYDDEIDKADLETIKSRFLQSVTGAGLKKNQFTEDKSKYEDYSSQAITILFETASQEDYKKLRSLKRSRNVEIGQLKTIYKPVTDLETLAKKALQNATERAAAIANAMTRKLGDLISVTDVNSNFPDMITEGYYSDQKHGRYYLSVKYSVK